MAKKLFSSADQRPRELLLSHGISPSHAVNVHI